MIKHNRYKMPGETTLWAARKRGGVYSWAGLLLRVLKAFLPSPLQPTPWSLAGDGTHWQGSWLYCFSLVPGEVALDSGRRPVGWSALATFQVSCGV